MLDDNLSLIFKNPITNDLPKYDKTYDKTQFDTFVKAMQSTNLTAKQVADTMDFEVNPAFISYAENTNKTQLTTSGLEKHIKSTNASFIKMAAKSKIAAIGVGLLNSAMSAGVSLLAGYLISGIINYFDEQHESIEEIAQAASDARSKIEELQNALKTKQDLVKTSAQRYAELAQGVNKFTGENNELSTAEYNEFLDLSNQLAEAFPSLSRTYTENGDVIVGLSGDIDTIVASLEDLIDRARELTNMDIAKEAPAVFKGVLSKDEEYKNQISEYETDLDLLQSYQSALSQINAESLGTGHIMIADDDITKMNALNDAYAKIFEAADAKYFKSAPSGVIVNDEMFASAFQYDLDEENLNKVKENFDANIQDAYDYYQTKISELQDKIKTANENNKTNWTSLNSSVFGWLSTDDTYKVMSDELQTAVQKMTNNIDWGTALFEGQPIDDWSDVEGYIRTNILGIVSKIPDTLQTEFTNLMTADLPTGELIEKYIALIDSIIDQLGLEGDKAAETKQQFMSLISSDQDLLRRSRNKIRPTMSSEKDKQKKFDWLDTLDSSELELLLTLDIDKEMSLSNIQDALELAKAEAEKFDIDLEPIYKKLETLKTAYQTVSKAVKEYKENQYLTYDTLESLLQLDDKYLVGLMNENGQLQLNKEAFQGLAEAKLQELSVSIMLDTIDTIGSLKDEQTAIDYLRDSTIDLTQATWDDVEASIVREENLIAAAKAQGQDTTAREAALNQVAESARTRIELIKGTMGSLGENLNNIFKDTSGGKTKFSEQIDWSANSLSNLNNQLDALKEKLDNTFNLPDKLDIYKEMTVLNDQIVKATKKTSESYETAWTKASGKISSSYKQKIMSGETFSVENFSDEDTYKKVSAAQEAWEKWQQSIQDYNEALISQIQLKKDESNAIIADKEAQIGILDMQLESASTAKDKNKILDDQLELQKEINDELEKQAILEGNTNALAELKEKEKQQIKENEQQKRDNKRAENQVSIDTYKTQLEDPTLTEAEINSINEDLKKAVNKDFEYQFKDMKASIDDTVWKEYIQGLKKKYKETGMTDKKFIKKHIDEIAEHFDYTGMLQWLNEYYASDDSFDQTDYDTAKNARLYSINENDRQIQDIQNEIDLNGGIGTKKQYETIKSEQQSNKAIWEQQLIDAQKQLEGLEPGTQAWDDVNAEIQDIENNINGCNNAIKQCESSILNLPLKKIQDKLNDISLDIQELDLQITEQDTLLEAANYIMDDQIHLQEKEKEVVEKKIKALQREHDLREATLNVQKAEYELNKLKNNKSSKIFKEGVGFVYEADADEVNEAQRKFDEEKYNLQIANLEDQVNTYDEEIARLNLIKDTFSKIKTDVEGTIALGKAAIYDAEFYNKVLASDAELIQSISDSYSSLLTNKSSLEDEQSNLSTAESLIDDIIRRHSEGLISEEEANKLIAEVEKKYAVENEVTIESCVEASKKVAKLIIADVFTIKESSEEKSEDVNKSNEEIAESYESLYTSMADLFDQMGQLTNDLAQKFAAMASSITASIFSMKNGLTELASSKNCIASFSVNPKLNKISDEQLDKISNVGINLAQGIIGSVSPNIGKLTTTTPNVTTKNSTSNNSVSFTGDIVINSTGDVNSLSKDIVTQLPGAMLQTIYKK